ncbi:MAG: OmpA family protein [Alcanivorax sp.]|uniref:OmpA family protein n=1 Tax=Alcanivorax sp. TaxID=1872427 RepID=UPI003DA73EC1
MKKILALLPCIALISSPASATGIGSLPSTRDNDGKVSVDVGYYYQRSDFEGFDDSLADNAMEDIARDAPYLRLNYQFYPGWLLSGIYGYEDISNDPDQDSLELESDLRDTFFGMQLKGRLYESEQFDVGAFLQYTNHADYDFSGRILTTDYAIEADGLRDFLAGTMLQNNYPSFDVYGGIFYQDSSADIAGTVGTLNIRETIEVKSSMGGMVGVNFHVHDKWDINLEYQNRGDHGIDVAATYHFKKPRTETITKIVEVPVMAPVTVSTPVIKPDSFDATVHFAKGSNDIDQAQRVIFRKLALFLEQNPTATAYVEGHCDCTGPEVANQDLSEQRAMTVKHYLVEYYAIEADRIKTEGFGESMPVDTNDTPEGRQNNRRVRVYATTGDAGSGD